MTETKVNGSMTNVTVNNTAKNEKKIATAKVEELINKEDKITLEDFAPDGGWGWMIALARILIMFTMLGPTSSFAIIFGDFLEDSGHAGMASSLINSVFMITFSIASLLTNTLLKRYSTRPVGIISALLFAISDIALAFVRNIYDMAFIYFIQGFGFGLIVTVTNTIFNSYFVKKRAKVMYATQVIIALGGIIYPMLCEKILPLYGFRGTMAIIGALSFNSVVGMTVMHPVEWHAKKPKDVCTKKARETKQKIFQELKSSNRRSTIDVVHLFSKTKWSSFRSLKEERGTEMSLPNETFKFSAQRVASVSTAESRERVKSESIWESLSRRTSAISASSLVNLATRTICVPNDIQQLHLDKRNNEKQTNKINENKKKKQNKEIQEKKEKQYNLGEKKRKIQEKKKRQDKEIQIKEERKDIERKQKMTKLVVLLLIVVLSFYIISKQNLIRCKIILKELVDMSLVKNWCFINLCFGVSFVYTSDVGFSSLLPLMMTDMGYSKTYAALGITIKGIAELVSKILLSIFTLIVTIKSKYIFFAATIFMGFARTGFLLYGHTLKGALITISIIGAVRSWLLVPLPLIIIEDLHIEKFASAYGINSVISTVVTIIFGAIVGIIKDWTGSYKIYQISLLILNSVFILPWALQFILVDFRKLRNQRARETNTKVIDHQ